MKKICCASRLCARNETKYQPLSLGVNDSRAVYVHVGTYNFSFLVFHGNVCRVRVYMEVSCKNILVLCFDYLFKQNKKIHAKIMAKHIKNSVVFRDKNCSHMQFKGV